MLLMVGTLAYLWPNLPQGGGDGGKGPCSKENEEVEILKPSRQSVKMEARCFLDTMPWFTRL